MRCSKTVLFAALLTAPFAGVASADIVITDAYARVSRPGAPTAAAFMQITNTGNTDDVLISVASDVAARVELHTHIDLGNGVLRMTELENGIAVGANDTHLLARGGDHVMFMGLTRELSQGDAVTLTLTFDRAGDRTITVPVDNDRRDAPVAHDD